MKQWGSPEQKRWMEARQGGDLDRDRVLAVEEGRAIWGVLHWEVDLVRDLDLVPYNNQIILAGMASSRTDNRVRSKDGGAREMVAAVETWDMKRHTLKMDLRM